MNKSKRWPTAVFITRSRPTPIRRNQVILFYKLYIWCALRSNTPYNCGRQTDKHTIWLLLVFSVVACWGVLAEWWSSEIVKLWKQNKTKQNIERIRESVYPALSNSIAVQWSSGPPGDTCVTVVACFIDHECMNDKRGRVLDGTREPICLMHLMPIQKHTHAISLIGCVLFYFFFIIVLCICLFQPCRGLSVYWNYMRIRYEVSTAEWCILMKWLVLVLSALEWPLYGCVQTLRMRHMPRLL